MSRDELLPHAAPERRPGDPLLDGIVAAETEVEREAAVAEILAEHAYDRIEKILAACFRKARMDPEQLDDLRNEVIVRVVSRFRRLVQSGSDPIESFSNYVATMAFNAFDDFVRTQFPLRSKLRNRTLYALTHEPGLALWTHAGVRVCGLTQWKGIPPDASVLTPALASGGGGDLRATLRNMFARSGAPLALEEVVYVLSAAAGIPRNETPRPLDEANEISAPNADPTVDLVNIQYLRTLWKEIGALPIRQKGALLLQARDSGGESVTHLLPIAGIATVSEIARSLEMSSEEFALWWPRLPVDDLTLAKRFNVTRQQVINLRRAARSRLLRRMPASGGWA